MKNPKQYWNILNEITGLNKDKVRTTIKKLKYKNITSEDDKEISNILNVYYCEMACELIKGKENKENYKEVTINTSNYKNPSNNTIINSMVMEQTNRKEVLDII